VLTGNDLRVKEISVSVVTPARVVTTPVASHWAWLGGGFVAAFAIPFVLTDLLGVNRDVFYGLYAIAVLGLIGLWAHSTGYDLRASLRRRWPLAVGLGVVCGGVLTLMVVRTEDATARPDGIELAGAVIWRGIVYGVSDALLLSVFPILVVFAAMAGSRLNERRAGKVVIGALALIASLAMTGVYHAGYNDFRSDKIARPLAGDVVWSVPTLVTLNPIGSPIAHVGLHTSAVLHSYYTDTFLPPHVSPAARVLATPVPPESQRILDGLTTGTGRIAPGATAFVSTPDGTWVSAAGLADVSTGEAMKPDARMRLESVSKIWTGSVVLRLAQDGRLRTTDTVERWLPGLLPYGNRIRIAELLTHTSGLIDNNDMAAHLQTFIARVKDPVTRAQLTRVATGARNDPAIEYPPKLWIELAGWQPLLSTPGTAYHYSNIGFEILGLIASRAAGQDLPSLYRDIIIDALGLESASYDPQGPISGSHARGYVVPPSKGALTDSTDWHGGIGAEGGIVANATDTGRFLRALMRGEVIDLDWMRRMKAGLFWAAPELGACGAAFGHSGGGAGFKSDVLVSPDGDRVAVLLMNGRAGKAADDAAHRAIWDLYCTE
jgi:D-alanyl-D-alanine carboxypeptidase